MGRTYRRDRDENDPYHEKRSSRDKKKRYKAGKDEKRNTKRQERSKNRDFIRHIDDEDYEDMLAPKFRKHNDYDHN